MDFVVNTIRRFNRFYTNILGLLDQHLLKSDFSLSEARVLYEIGNAENCTAKMLIDLLRLDPGYLSRILKRFAKQELVYRTQSVEDGRLYHLHLTEKGKVALARLEQLSNEQIRLMIGHFPEQVQYRIAKHMKAVERSLTDDPESKQAIQIRSDLKPGDAGNLIHLHGWIYAEECRYNHSFEGYVCRTLADFFENYRPEKDRFWFAETVDDLIGAIAIVGHSDREAQLRWFIVHPDYRGAGLGKRLLNEALQYCREKGFQRVFLETTSDQKTAIAMYAKTGFIKIKEHETHAWGVHHIEETYELRLS